MLDYHPFAEPVLSDPYPFYRRLRDEKPVLYLEEFDAWFVSRFEDIWSTLQQSRSLTTGYGVTPDQLLDPRREPNPAIDMLALMDPPEHTHVRAGIRGLFTPGFVTGLEPDTREIVRRYVEALARKGGGDLLNDFGLRISVRVAARIIGLPESDADMLARLVASFFHREPGQAGITPAGFEAIGELTAYMIDHVGRRRRGGAPGEDVIGLLAGLGLEDAAIAAHAQMLLIGGTETLPKVFAAGAQRLWQHPEQRALLAREPQRASAAFQEIARHDMPTQMLGRVVTKEIEVGAELLRPGQAVLFLWPSGNRDEREFTDPDRFDIERDAPRILSFGHGQHMCLGAHVARMEGRIMLEELLARLPHYEVLESEAVFMPSEFLRGFESLPVRC